MCTSRKWCNVACLTVTDDDLAFLAIPSNRIRRASGRCHHNGESGVAAGVFGGM